MARPALIIGTLAIATFIGCDAKPTKASPDAAAANPRPSATGTGALADMTPAPEPEWKKLLDAWKYPAPIPNFELTDQDGKKFHLADFSDDYVFVGLIFTNCSVPTACPLTTKQMREVQELWAKRQAAGDTKGRKLQLLTLSFDPVTDTPAVLKKYGEKYGADFSNWTFATGPEELLSKGLPSLFGVLAMPDGGGSYAHNVRTALLAPGLNDYEEWTDNAFNPAHVVDLVLKGAPPAKTP